VAGVLELRREKESAAGSLALLVNALLHGLISRTTCRIVALGDVVGPEVPTRLIRLTIQEIVIMLANKVFGIDDGIG
jgi:hypothetical protein